MCTRCRHAVALAVARVLTVLLTAPLVAGAPYQICDVTTGNYTDNSTYSRNLQLAIEALPSNVSTSPALFSIFTAGTAPNKVYALGQCMGEQVDASACHACIADCFDNAKKLCPNYRGAAILYDTCILGFSDVDFVASRTNSKDREIRLTNPANVAPDVVARFDASAFGLLYAMADYVVTANLTNKSFITGVIGFDATYPNIYAVASCTPDLTPEECRGCLVATTDEMPQANRNNTKGARIAGMRCAARYEAYNLFNGSAMVQLAAIQAGNKTNKTAKILAIVLPTTVVALGLSMAICLCYWRRRTKSKRSLSFASRMEDIESIESLLIDLSTIRTATNNFSENNKLGEGGFGSVYKGTLPNSQEIAVKRLSQNSRQGIGELKNELALIAKLQHKNLVRLVGVCLQEEERLLVYEYMPNTSLDTFLFDSEKRKVLEWGKRFSIINGIARGLQYLHEESQLKIVHRDLKASNVLLDADMNPKISDFGLAKLFEGDQSQDTTNRVVGTYGYMAPEYALRGQYSIKSDIYSFGVLILEIITGRRNSDSYNSDQAVDLPSLTWEHWTMKTVMEIVDPYLRSDSSEDEILRCIYIGLSCVQEDPLDRPSISAISIMLDSNTVPSQTPSRPAFYIEMSGNFGSGMCSQTYPGVINDSATKSIAMSLNELSITDPEPR